MKEKTVFSQIILIVAVALICAVLTAGTALVVGLSDTNFFDFANFNFSNVIPVLIIGGVLSCIIIGITVVFVSGTIFEKVKNYFLK